MTTLGCPVEADKAFALPLQPRKAISACESEERQQLCSASRCGQQHQQLFASLWGAVWAKIQVSSN